MLTKELVRYRFVGGKALPCFLDPDDTQVNSLSEELLSLFENSRGKQVKEIKEALDQCSTKLHPAFQGLAKLFFDRCTYVADESIETERWQRILEAQTLRREQLFHTREAFQETLSGVWGKSLGEIQEKLYGDLPDFQRVENFEKVEPKALVHRYNCALVQGLVLFATRLRVSVEHASLVERRNLFRAIKFHRLVVGNFTSDEGRLSFELEGPLSVMMSTQAYGFRMANFFPHLPFLEEWRMEACLKLKNRECRLELTHRQGLRSHYREWGGYVPEEFEQFVSSFNERYFPWQVRWSDQLVHLEKQDFCFPDFTFTHLENGRTFYFELFHRWHKGNLIKRLNTIQKLPSHPLRIGVCQSLYKQDSIRTIIEKNGQFLDKFLVTFREFPTPKLVNSFLI